MRPALDTQLTNGPPSPSAAEGRDVYLASSKVHSNTNSIPFFESQNNYTATLSESQS